MEGLPVVVVLGSLPLDYRPLSKLSVTEAMMLDGSVLAAIEGIIVVTVHYRRDMFGKNLFPIITYYNFLIVLD